MGITGEQDRPPVRVGVALTDVLTGLFAHSGILAALLARDRPSSPAFGKGQHINTSLLESQVATLVNIGSSYLIGDKVRKRVFALGS